MRDKQMTTDEVRRLFTRYKYNIGSLQVAGSRVDGGIRSIPFAFGISSRIYLFVCIAYQFISFLSSRLFALLL